MRSSCTSCLRTIPPPLALAAALWASGWLPPPAAHAELLINEVLSAPVSDWNADGTVDFRNDEWVEIINTGPGVEALDGVYVRDGTGTEYHYGFTGSLAPGDVRVVFGSEAVAWQTAHGLSTTGLSLNNGGDRVELWRDTTDPIVLQPLDTVTVPAHAAADERALGRDSVGQGWALFDALNPYNGAAQPGHTGCSPTPGQVNECSPGLPDAHEHWGALKARFAAN